MAYAWGAVGARFFRSGRREAALEHLLAAAALEPETVREWAKGDSDLDSLRDDPSFPA